MGMYLMLKTLARPFKKVGGEGNVERAKEIFKEESVRGPMEPRSIRLPEADSGFVLEEFKAWYGAIDPEDRIEFQLTYQGTTELFHFVYLLDKWLISGGKWNRPNFDQILEAYAVSHRCNKAEARAKYPGALEHDAVKSLLSRLTYRETLSSHMRILHKHHKLAEILLDQAVDAASNKDLSEAATFDEDGAKVTDGSAQALKLVQIATKAAEGIATQQQGEAAAQRAERTRNAMQRARDAAAALGAGKEPTEDELAVFIKHARDKLGTARFHQLLDHLDLPEPHPGGRTLSSEPGDHPAG